MTRKSTPSRRATEPRLASDDQPGDEDGHPAKQRGGDGVQAQAVELVVGLVAEVGGRVYLAANLTLGEKVGADVQEDAGGEPEDDGVQHGVGGQVNETRGERGETDATGGHQQHGSGRPLARETAGSRVASGALVRDDCQPQQQAQVRCVAVDDADDRPRGEGVSGEFDPGVLERAGVGEPVADRVSSVAKEESTGDAEPAVGRVVADRVREQEHRRTRYHRATCQPVAPHQRSTAAVDGCPSPEWDRPRHRPEGDPGDPDELPRRITGPDGPEGQHHEPRHRGGTDRGPPRGVINNRCRVITHHSGWWACQYIGYGRQSSSKRTRSSSLPFVSRPVIWTAPSAPVAAT